MKKEAMLYEKLDGFLQCCLCAHRCKIAQSRYGICGVRQNLDGKLYTHTYGKVIAAHIDPIEKKPLFHFFPGSVSFSIATVGCNFRCGFCQNWQISQASKTNKDISGHELWPQDIVRQAKKNNCKSISYTYTEPTIFFEYAFDTSKLAKEQGLLNNFVTNGYMTKEALETISPYLDACNVDLKSFNEEFYKKTCGAHLQPVLDSIELMKKLGIWIEVTTLIIPGENDSKEELTKIAAFISSVGIDIPWHISRFHPDYKYLDKQATPIKTLKEAESIGKKAGLRYVYMGNCFGASEDTHCYSCGRDLIKRNGYAIERFEVKNSSCPYCKVKIDGVF